MMLFLHWVPELSESVRESCRSGISGSYSTLCLLDISPISFQSQVFWGLISLVQVLRVGAPDVGLKPLAPQGEALFL